MAGLHFITQIELQALQCNRKSQALVEERQESYFWWIANWWSACYSSQVVAVGYLSSKEESDQEDGKKSLLSDIAPSRGRRRYRAFGSFLRSTRPVNALRDLTPASRRRPRLARRAAAMGDVSERTLQVSVLVAFASGVLVGWQANRLRRRYLDWRKRRLQDKLATTQKKLDLA
ncbi:LOW QUALITY PROTEIN: uncharacterized protein encoded by LINC00116-like [Octodon degus]|uniref:LOW QUALITY PROTEIN: uncharacterized protein encoded by LINC00116-like n=1 Tax=Octodon degus TaxID=10160 RepID=A0A6P6EL89_OCTDE|nr:LOW QUALITY PROTEIN: uncharacterized protein encoded by LINC00116-like [Octodon degus]